MSQYFFSFYAILDAYLLHFEARSDMFEYLSDSSENDILEPNMFENFIRFQMQNLFERYSADENSKDHGCLLKIDSIDNEDPNNIKLGIVSHISISSKGNRIVPFYGCKRLTVSEFFELLSDEPKDFGVVVLNMGNSFDNDTEPLKFESDLHQFKLEVVRRVNVQTRGEFEIIDNETALNYLSQGSYFGDLPKIEEEEDSDTEIDLLEGHQIIGKC